eukprot:1977432-Karenia_brevis.AAC.1
MCIRDSPLGALGDQSPITLASGPASASRTPRPTSVPNAASSRHGRSSSSGGQTAFRPAGSSTVVVTSKDDSFEKVDRTGGAKRQKQRRG